MHHSNIVQEGVEVLTVSVWLHIPATGTPTQRKGCHHGHMLGSAPMLSSTLKAKLTAAAAVVDVHTRQLLQAPPRRPPAKPAAPLNPTQRKGFATGRGPSPKAAVQRQRRPAPAGL